MTHPPEPLPVLWIGAGQEACHLPSRTSMGHASIRVAGRRWKDSVALVGESPHRPSVLVLDAGMQLRVVGGVAPELELRRVIPAGNVRAIEAASRTRELCTLYSVLRERTFSKTLGGGCSERF